MYTAHSDLWRLLQCTVGFGDIHAENDPERLFMCVVLVITALSYAIIFGNVAVQIQELDKVSYKRMLPVLQRLRLCDWAL